MTAVIASIDIGSHTARLLVARTGEHFSPLTPLVRRRAYTRLAGDFVRSGRRIIPRPAIERLTAVVGDLLSVAEYHRAACVCAAATGVLRDAENRAEVFEAIRHVTGLEVRCLSGEEEALLTSAGVVDALGLGDAPYAVFDIGGGSTEIVVDMCGTRSVASIPLGASVLTARWLTSDPPAAVELAELESAVAEVLAGGGIEAPERRSDMVLAGTGGTVTALAAVLEGVEDGEIVPERINGVPLDLPRILVLLDRWKSQSLEERMVFSGLDEGRAEVIVAGAMVVGGILRHFGVGRLTACMSDLLESLIIESGGKI